MKGGSVHGNDINVVKSVFMIFGDGSTHYSVCSGTNNKKESGFCNIEHSKYP
jgi:hypothetical protein